MVNKDLLMNINICLLVHPRYGRDGVQERIFIKVELILIINWTALSCSRRLGSKFRLSIHGLINACVGQVVRPILSA